MAIGINFKYTIKPPSDGGKWGHVTADGKDYGGIVGDCIVRPIILIDFFSGFTSSFFRQKVLTLAFRIS